MPALDFPSSPIDGQVFGNYIYDNGVGVWRASPQVASGLPAGTIVQWPGVAAPTSWLICDGSAVARATYPSLFNAIGTTYGAGDGSSTFNLPNLKGKVAVGLDTSQTEFNSLGKTGGATTHTLSISEMPSHTHTGTTSSNGSHTHGGINYSTSNDGSTNGNVRRDYGANYNQISFYAGDHTHTFTTDSTGSGSAHNNLQPYVVLNYIIKTSAGITTGDSELASRVGAVELGKAPLAGPTFTGTVSLPSTTSIGNVSSTELGYIDGVTSAIQTQLDGKAATSHVHAASDITSGTFAYGRMPSGTIIQAVTSTTTTQVSGANGWNNTGLSGSITPRTSTSRFIVLISLGSYSTRGSGGDTGFSARILRDGTQIWIDPASYETSYVYAASGAVIIAKNFIQVNDYTGSTGTSTYTVQFYTYAGGTTYFQHGGTNSQMTILEVAP